MPSPFGHDAKHTDDELNVAAAGLSGRSGDDGRQLRRVRTHPHPSLCVDRLGVAAGAVDSLLDQAERQVRESVDIYGFMRVIMKNFEHDEQVMLIELLWSVAYADGAVDEHEAALIRKIVGMTGVTDREAGEARKKAAAAAKAKAEHVSSSLALAFHPRLESCYISRLIGP